MKGHTFSVVGSKKRSTVTGCPWPVCKRCGLVLLKNRASKIAAKRPCEGLEDPVEPG